MTIAEIMQINTHQSITHSLCGTPLELIDNHSSVRLVVGEQMAVDDRGLVHGGFIFSLADHAAMLAVNLPNVVLANASVNFVAPVVVGDELTAEAKINFREGKKRLVRVNVYRGDGEEVFNGEFLCVVTKQHVLNEGAGR